VKLKVPGCDLPDLPDAPDVTHQATAIAAVVREQDKDRQRPQVRIVARQGAFRAARYGLQVSQLNAQPEMKDEHRGHGAHSLEPGVLSCRREDSPFRFTEAKISGFHKAETFAFE